MTESKFSKDLIDKYIAMMQWKFGVERSLEDAELDLDSLGELFLVFSPTNKEN